MARKPQAVQRLADEADRIAKELQNKPASDDSAAGATVTDIKPSGDAPSDAASAAAQSDVIDPEEFRKLQSQYQSLQGIYKSDKDRFAAELEDLRKKQSEDAEYIAQLEEASLGQPALTDDDVKNFGESELDIVKKAAADQVKGPLSDLTKELKTLKSELANVSQQLTNVSTATERTSVNSLYTFLDSAVSDWRKLNEDKDFLNWLSVPDPFSGRSRQELLEAAQTEKDFPRVAHFFNAYLNEKPPAGTPSPTPAFRPAPGPQDVSMQFVAPGGAPAGGAPTPSDSSSVSVSDADIRKFYADVRSGVYANHPEERQRREQEIHKAINEGRFNP